VTIQSADEDAGTFRLTAEAAKYGAATITVKAVAVGRDVDQWIATTTFKFSVNSPVNDPNMTKALDDQLNICRCGRIEFSLRMVRVSVKSNRMNLDIVFWIFSMHRRLTG
jgi:hypothetical protein